jgi:hypothetical protein
VGIASGSQDLEDTVIDGENGDIESSTTEIADDDLGFTTLLVETVGDGSRGGFVGDPEDLETGNGAGVLGCLTLGVIEVGRNGDDGVSDLLAEVSLGGLLHFGQDHGGNFFGCELPLFTAMRDRDSRFPILLNNLERPI